jgi:predicted metal-dependent hydrolase
MNAKVIETRQIKVNKTENIVIDKEIGRVRYVHNHRAKNLSIRISRHGEVRVTVPRLMGMMRAEAFVERKKGWILKKLTEIRRQQQQLRMPVPGELLRVRGREIPIELKNGEKDVEEAIWAILLKEAKACLPGRVRELAAEFGFSYRTVKIRKMTSRWGSCSVKNSINLNSWLVMLPGHLCDYVILHELVHTRYRDHGERFWKALDRVTDGSSRALRKELREQKIMYFHPGTGAY